MRRTSFFLPTLRETPKEAEIVSHRLMLRAGMIRQASAGIYSWLPLGHRVLRKIEQIVREDPKVGRNDPCPCGSGKKYKKCCGRNVG